MARKVILDKELCIGCGLCESVYPECFKLEGDGKASVVCAAAANEAKCQEAIDSCPVQAIFWVE